MKSKSILITIAILILSMSVVAQVKGTFTDKRDGKIYKTVKIGSQTWMAENLAYGSASKQKKCNYTAIFSRERYNGSKTVWEYMIFCNSKELITTFQVTYYFVDDNTSSFIFNTLSEKLICGLYGESIRYDTKPLENRYGHEIGRTNDKKDAAKACIEYYYSNMPNSNPVTDCAAYSNDDNNAKVYGYLYTWAAAKTACPVGWHLPSDAEWTKLNDFLGGEELAATKMKTTSGWKANGNGSNSSGFSGLPGGSRNKNGDFKYLGEFGSWWTSAENGADYARTRELYYESDNLISGGNDKKDGLSVRCVKD